jgi:2'-5' RNA ligase
MKSVIRAFIAIELSPGIQSQLDEIQKQLRNQINDHAIHWVRSQNIHLTLKFLGDVSITNLDDLKNILADEAIKHEPFEITIGNLGAFPNNNHPRVIWVGVQAPLNLNSLQHNLELQLEKLGFAREERSFSPHLTLGRITRNITDFERHSVTEVLNATRIGFLGAVRVNAIHLFKSDLLPSGAVYSRLYTTNLKTVENIVAQ